MDDRFKSGGRSPLTFQQIADRLLDVNGNSVQPKRGINIIDELTKVSRPVQVLNLESSTAEELAKDSGHTKDGYLRSSSSSTYMPPNSDHVAESDGLENLRPSGMSSNSGNNSKPMSYVESVLAAKPVKVNFRSLASTGTYEGCDVVLPRDSIRAVQEKLANTLYGYFLGDRVAYPVVDYFVKNQWKRFGLQKSMMNANGFFFFKFADEAGMLNVLKEGPWIIRSQPLFLHIWSPTSKLEKKEVKKLQVWVKIHDVPLAAYTEDGLSMIATAIGEPKMLDTYTSSMCIDNWGRSSYARALVEISAENGFKEEIVMAVPELEGEGFSKVVLSVEYEWSPLRCAHCKVFGHSDDSCPSQPRRAPKGPITGQNKQEGSNSRKQVKQPAVDKEGFTDVERKKAAWKSGFPVNKQKQKFEYRPIGSKPQGGATTSGPPPSVKTHNPFDVLSDTGKNVGKNGEAQHDQQDSEEEEALK
ncbi:uncharacterized protein LOC110889597 [Helianthus annuus]|uniref:uncharacterized protein LOC110889597 n=1 Tax=Helianthus annuus TaxID=4232 RepID=UPI000B9067C2|nr:uncharacterized protein LOC110889597 [Helianthus annuus]